MDSSTPPPIPPQIPASPPTSSFPSQAATFSLFAPFVAMGISILGQPQVSGYRWAMVILGLAAVLLILSGLALGITALIASKGLGRQVLLRQGIVRRAMAGTCICGILTLLMVISIPGLMRAAERAKKVQKQRMEQRQ